MRWGIAKHMPHGCAKEQAAKLQRDLNSI
jgi:hypothetical protein